MLVLHMQESSHVCGGLWSGSAPDGVLRDCQMEPWLLPPHRRHGAAAAVHSLGEWTKLPSSTHTKDYKMTYTYIYMLLIMKTVLDTFRPLGHSVAEQQHTMMQAHSQSDVARLPGR